MGSGNEGHAVVILLFKKTNQHSAGLIYFDDLSLSFGSTVRFGLTDYCIRSFVRTTDVVVGVLITFYA